MQVAAGATLENSAIGLNLQAAEPVRGFGVARSRESHGLRV